MMMKSPLKETQDSLFTSLNEEQRHAVTATEGPVLIIAGPGTGKTRVITYRIAYLLREKIAKGPCPILALTFTKKAAEEMRVRLEELLPSLKVLPNIATYHSFAREILETYGIAIGLGGPLKILSSDLERAWILKKILLTKRLSYFTTSGNLRKLIAGLLSFINRAKDELVKPEDYLKYLEEKKIRADSSPLVGEARWGGDENSHPPLAPLIKGGDVCSEAFLDQLSAEEIYSLYAAYEEACLREGVIDFGGLLIKVVDLFKERPNVLKKVRESTPFILVDEFQDSNMAQIEILRLLAEPERNICVVGDDDQAIYRFRGASYASFKKFKEIFPEARVIPLVQNYRSTSSVLEVAQASIRHNGEDRFDRNKVLWTNKKGGQPVEIHVFNNDLDEAEWIAKRIRELETTGFDQRREETPISYKDMAILVRTHTHKERIKKALERWGIPYNQTENSSLFAREEIRLLTAYLQVISHPDRDAAMARILLEPPWGMTPRDLRRLGEKARHEKKSFFDLLAGFSEEEEMPGRTRILELYQRLEEITAFAEKEPVDKIIRRLLSAFHLVSDYVRRSDPACDRVVKNLASFYEFAREFSASAKGNNRVRDFLDLMDMDPNAGGGLAPSTDFEEENQNGVRLLTLHAAKGLEFPVVFIASLVEGRFPTREREETIPFPEALIKEPLPAGDFHEEEERRLFYVGITRAKEALYLTAVERPRVRLSLFLKEILAGEGELPLRLVRHPPEEPAPSFASLDSTIEEEAQWKEVRQIVSRFVAERADPALTAEDLKSIILAFLQMKGMNSLERFEKALPFLEEILNPEWVEKIEKELTSIVARSSPPLGGRGEGRLPLPFALSHTQIETYEWCPLKYKFHFIYRIPAVESAHLVFGVTIHKTLEHFYRRIQEGRVPSLEDLLSLYVSNWVSKGFQSPGEEEGYREKGRLILTRYFEDHREEFTRPPLFLEEAFRLKTEAIEITGKIDRIEGMGGNRVEVIDYKTGKAKDQKFADESFQLSLYAMAVREAIGLEPEILSFYYLETGEKISTRVDEARIEKAKAKILETAGKIALGEFPPCSESKRFIHCRDCEYRILCPVWDE